MTTGGTINIVGWYPTVARTLAVPMKIYLKETASSTLTSDTWANMISGAALVYDASMTTITANVWNSFTLTTTFPYGGTNNILVLVETNYGGGGGSTSSSPSVRYSAATTMHETWAQDNTPPTGSGTTSSSRPNIQFEITTTSPSLSVVPSSLAFGYVPSGGTYEYPTPYQLSGTNLTAGPILVTAPTGFEVSLTGGGIDFGSSVNVTYTEPTLASTPIYVRFIPTGAPAAYSDNVTNVGGSASANVAVTGSSDLFSLYCTSGASSSGDEDITLVQFGSTLNNTSPCASLVGSQGTATGTANLYSNFTSITPTDIVQGLPVPISVEITECGGSAYGHDVRVYIDFNQNGLLTDPGEETIIWAYTSSNTHTINADINVPLGATLGNTLMRVVCKESSTTGPCLVSSWGETEDYKVNIIAGSTATLTYYNLQWPDSATIEVTQNTTVYAQCWESGVTEAAGPGTGIVCWIGYSSTDTDPSTWTNWVATTYNYGIDPNSNDEYQADLGFAQGLTPGTYYYASRFSYLNGPFTYGGYPNGAWNGTTQVSGVLTVTPCGVASIPYFENFDNVTAPAFPICMTVENTNADAYTWETNTTAFSAPNSARISYNSFLAMDDWFFTQGLSLTGGVTYEVGFVYAAASSYYPENLSVDWGTSASSADMSGSPIYTHNGITGGWYIGSPTFTPSTTGVYYVGFHGHSLADEYYLYVDDISVKEATAATTWTGTTDNDWNTASNWTGGIPTSGADVTIPSTVVSGNFPTVSEFSSCNTILLESDAAGNASLIDNGLLFVYGNVTMQQYLDAQTAGGNDNWHFISSPLSGQTADVFHLSASTGLNVYLQSFDETTNLYSDMVSGGLNPAEGYAVWVDGANATPPVTNYTFEYQGDFNYGTFTSNLTRSIAGDNGGNNLVGNPYTSSLDWDAAGWTKTNVQAAYYVEDQGSWGIYDMTNGSTGTGNQGQFIAPGQGFFALVMDDGSLTGTLTMDNTVRAHSTAQVLKSDYSNYLRLQATGNNRKDIAVVHFMENADVLFNGLEDARKMFAIDPSYPQIYTVADKMLAANALPETETVPMGFTSGVDGSYTIEAIEINDISSVWLEDTFTGIFTNLTSDSYSFTYSTGDAADRFILHFAPIGVDDNYVDNTNIYSYGKDVYVNVTEITSGDIVIYNLMGQKVISTSISGHLNKVTLKEGGYYVVVVRNDEAVVTEKVFIK